MSPLFCLLPLAVIGVTALWFTYGVLATLSYRRLRQATPDGPPQAFPRRATIVASVNMYLILESQLLNAVIARMGPTVFDSVRVGSMPSLVTMAVAVTLSLLLQLAVLGTYAYGAFLVVRLGAPESSRSRAVLLLTVWVWGALPFQVMLWLALTAPYAGFR